MRVLQMLLCDRYSVAWLLTGSPCMLIVFEHLRPAKDEAFILLTAPLPSSSVLCLSVALPTSHSFLPTGNSIIMQLISDI